MRHGIDDIDVAGGSGSGWAGEGNSLYCDQLTYILLLTRTREGGWQVEVQLQYSQLFCFCLLHVFIPLCSQHVTTLCLLHLPVRFCSRSVPSVLLSTLRFVHRSGSVTVVNPLLPVPGSVDCYFSHSVPGRYRLSRANLLRFCEFCGFQSIFFIVVSSGELLFWTECLCFCCIIYALQRFTLVATRVEKCKKRLFGFTTLKLCSMILLRHTNYCIDNALSVYLYLFFVCTKIAFFRTMVLNKEIM